MPRPQNLDKEVIKVAWKDINTNLNRFVSSCPVCKEGLLMGRRELETFRLLPDDICILCGQRFIYTDIDDNPFNFERSK